ncbi:MAG: ABC-type transport auxiliary lipoprotein family protein [Burkholderiales bacterium]
MSLAVAFILAGCGGAAAPEPRSYDLGIEAPGAKLPPVRVGGVRAAAPFDSTDMQYRLAYRNASEIAAFANSRWAATPAELLRKQLQRASTDGGKCVLSVEIQEFTQIFSAKEASEARVELRATLSSGASRQFSVAEGNGGVDAVSGAAALARAANRAVGEIGSWISSQPGCR